MCDHVPVSVCVPQEDLAPERDVRKAFVPVQAADRQHINPGRDNLR